MFRIIQTFHRDEPCRPPPVWHIATSRRLANRLLRQVRASYPENRFELRAK